MQGLKIGNVQLPGRVLLAPMAGYGDIAFRRLCRDYGAALTTTDMVSCKGLLYNNERTLEMLRLAPNESPSSVQLFGGEPDVFRRAVERPEIRAFDIVDINMGCPVPKVVRNGEGSALGADIPRAAACAAAAVKYAGRPVTVKIRLGFGEHDFTAPTLARALESEGVAAIAVHGRTAWQMYRGTADWEKIAAVKAAVKIPVIGNGDITSATDIRYRLQTVDAVMIGRGALGHPELFAEVAGEPADVPMKAVIFRHIEYMLAYFPPAYTVANMRKHLHCYLHGVPGTKELKAAVNRTNDIEEMRALIDAAL